MAISRVKVWIAGEVLTASDLNAEFNNILNNAASMISPLGGNLVFTPDATYDIGASGLTRPRNLYLSGAITAGGAGAFSGALSATNLALATGTITTSQPETLTQTWNAGGVTFTAMQVNVTDTASAAASLLADLQVGGASKFTVSKTGALTAVGTSVSSMIGSVDGEFQLKVQNTHATNGFGLQVRGGNSNSNSALQVADYNGNGLFSVTGVGVIQHTASLTANYAVNFSHSGASPFGIDFEFTGAAPNDTSHWFLYCADTSASRHRLAGNGGYYNFQANDINLSDMDIKPITQRYDTDKLWEFGKRMRKAWIQFKYDDQVHDDWNNGYGAQLVQEAAGEDFPELVELSDWGTKENPQVRLGVYSSDLGNLMNAITTESQFRIESLESTLARLVEEFNEYRKNHQ